ncbi:MAG: hypothetical protein JXC85_03165 [Candidatus Aenigmarchaeota archaeon]|nr:hypothetical protein [Candidatus Aenigmarchaeota archaeon]
MKKSKENVTLSTEEKRKYPMPTERDYEILSKIKKLEKLRLTKEDRELVNFIRTQLEDDWRTPLIRALNKLLRKY